MGISTLIKTLTASGSVSLDFVDGTADVVLDGTYDEYMFVCTDIAPDTDNVQFSFQVNATDDPGGGYDTSLITSTAISAYHREDDGSTPNVSTEDAHDQAQGSGFQSIAHGCGSASDESVAGILHLFNPASTTLVKNFYSTFSINRAAAPTAIQLYVSGYIDDTTAIDEIQFKMSSGNFDGVIQLYGIA